MPIMRILVILFMCFVAISPAHALEREGIAAVVNNNVVTFSDIKARSALVTNTANRKFSPDMLRKIKLDSLDALINEDALFGYAIAQDLMD